MTSEKAFKLSLDIRAKDETEPLWMAIASGEYNIGEVARALARREGFESFEAMRDWFISAKKIRPGKPYIGHQIEWKFDASPGCLG